MKLAALALCLGFTALASAQESYWVANRFSTDITEINTGGKVLNTVPLSSYVGGVRSVHRAPDGKLWVVGFITPTFLIVDPVTHAVTPIVHSSGNPFSIAFDAAGHAWITGGSSIVEYDANGNNVASYPMTAGSPLGISIDGNGNKWIAHRTTAPGSISRIDPTGAVTNYPLPSGGIQPTQILADHRGILVPSHIWVIGDGPAQLFEFDDNGVFLNMYTYSGQLGSIAQDATGDLWLGDFSGAANLFRVDPATGTALNTYNSLPTVNGVAVDGFNHIWASVRVSFSGPVPSEVRRIDANTGAMEIAAVVGLGTQSSMSTGMQYAMVVDAFGDLDGDGVANLIETQNGSSPFDGCSNGNTSISASGVTQIGNGVTFDVTAPTGSFSVVGFSFLSLSAANGIQVPGFGCTLRLDPTLMGGFTGLVGSGAINLNLPNNPAIVGFELYAQAATFASVNQLSNLTMIKVW